MGLRSRLAGVAVRAPHLLLVEAPGAWRARVAVEQAIGRRGWRAALAPADADVLVICGEPPADYDDPVERTWDQLPGPRARVTVVDATAVEVELDRAVKVLGDDDTQRADAHVRVPATDDADRSGHGHDDHGQHDAHLDHDDMAHGHMSHGDIGNAEAGHDALDHRDLNHGHMDHGHTDMTGPGGIALAAGGPDRDGLAMDVLHVRLGPVLAYWPAGLVLDLSLQGDVVTEAHVVGLAGFVTGVEDAATSAARRCDAAAALLTLAGWAGPAALARRVRDDLLDGGMDGDAPTVGELRRRVGRSRALRWSLRGLGVVTDATGGEGAVDLSGDVHDRLLRLLDLACDEVRTGHVMPTHDDQDMAVLLTGLVAGLDLAAVRLAVASVGGFAVSATAAMSGNHDD